MDLILVVNSTDDINVYLDDPLYGTVLGYRVDNTVASMNYYRLPSDIGSPFALRLFSAKWWSIGNVDITVKVEYRRLCKNYMIMFQFFSLKYVLSVIFSSLFYVFVFHRPTLFILVVCISFFCLVLDKFTIHFLNIARPINGNSIVMWV